MIRKGKGQYELLCDTCRSVISTGTKNFATAIEFQRAEGWRCYKDGQKWKSSCEKCVKEYARKQHEEEGWS